MDDYKTQKQRILDHLKTGRSITSFEAATKMGICHLQKSIQLLRRQGLMIKDERLKGSRSQYKRYWLENAVCR